MPKLLPIEIHIPKPCTQNWDEMTPHGQGRHCNHCSKTVIDFTKWSDSELSGFFSKKTGSVCGRMLTTQTNRYINIPAQPHSRLYVVFVALGLTLIFTSPTDTFAKIPPPFITQHNRLLTANNDDSTSKTSTVLSGTVLDDKREPIASAVIHVYRGDLLVSGAVADSNGAYLVPYLQPGYYDLLITCYGCDSVRISKVVISPIHPTTQNAIIKRLDNQNSTVVTGVIMTNYSKEKNHNRPKWHRKAHKRFRHK